MPKVKSTSRGSKFQSKRKSTASSSSTSSRVSQSTSTKKTTKKPLSIHRSRMKSHPYNRNSSLGTMNSKNTPKIPTNTATKKTSKISNTKTPNHFHIKTFDNRFLGNGDLWGLEILGDTNDVMHLDNHGPKVFRVNRNKELCDENGKTITFLPHNSVHGAYTVKVQRVDKQVVLEAIDPNNNSGGKYLAAAKDCLEFSSIDDPKSKFDLMTTLDE
ncbi:12667_t:CDS:2 [Ambispora gerdemannii]|uniref:12666_t:CDS:1 n=1 Tax=Ambispora gerdemannii TaxID=144530 RepID=A0A9N9BA78_9GLOM|nr:12666_t:CDS:2 [Ambispora gerdemannii]CAG8559021.1 12667_t:CDS:2 [Ambispora gerdemannii]